MKILITGGAGFIGTHLAKELSKKNEVSLLDMQDKWKDEHKTFKKYSVDLSKYESLRCIQEKFDLVYHLAAQTSGRVSMENPEMDCAYNSLATMNIARYCLENNIRKIVYTSSMAVYGNGADLKETSKLTPTSHYGISKLSGEYYIQRLQNYNVETTIFRLFNVYGPGQDMNNMKQGMVSIFLKQAMISNVINVTGSLQRYRDFVYIDDVINALILPMTNKKFNNEIFNVGNGKRVSVEELINTIVSMFKDRKITTKNIGYHDGDPLGNYSSCDKIISLGWQPRIDLKKGIKLFHDYQKGEHFD